MIDDPQTLFTRYLRSAYPQNWERGVLADVITMYPRNGISAAELSELDEMDQEAVINQLDTMRKVGLQELTDHTGLNFTCTANAIEQIDQWYDEIHVNDLIDHSTCDATGVTDVFIRSVEIGALLGQWFIEQGQAFAWLPTIPYWESPFYHRKTGSIVPVLHWAVKKFTSYGIEDGLLAKCQACVQRLETKPLAL